MVSRCGTLRVTYGLQRNAGLVPVAVFSAYRDGRMGAVAVVPNLANGQELEEGAR